MQKLHVASYVRRAPNGCAAEKNSRLFINYRRVDTGATASALYRDLATRLGKQSVFIDHDQIVGGEEWAKRLQKELELATDMLVLCGNKWLDIYDPNSQDRRLNVSGDWVREEIARAFERGIKVLPVIVEDASLPSVGQLPECIQKLAHLQTRPLRRTDWDYDIDVILTDLGFRTNRISKDALTIAYLIFALLLAVVFAVSPLNTSLLMPHYESSQSVAKCYVEASFVRFSNTKRTGSFYAISLADVPADAKLFTIVIPSGYYLESGPIEKQKQGGEVALLNYLGQQEIQIPLSVIRGNEFLLRVSSLDEKPRSVAQLFKASMLTFKVDGTQIDSVLK